MVVGGPPNPLLEQGECIKSIGQIQPLRVLKSHHGYENILDAQSWGLFLWRMQAHMLCINVGKSPYYVCCLCGGVFRHFSTTSMNINALWLIKENKVSPHDAECFCARGK